MAQERIVRTTCGMCSAACGVRVHVAGGRALKVEGDPESPVNRGAICPKGRAAVEYLYHPERLTHPLRRRGPRGAGRWERVAWDEALDAVAEELTRARAGSGPESVALVQGASKGFIQGYAERLAHAFGTPNVTTTGHLCFLPRLIAAKMTCGYYPIPDYAGRPALLVLWGANLAATRIGEHHRALQAVRGGSRVIVVDPLPTVLTPRAEQWLRLRPGSDLALALGLLQVIVSAGWIDRAFVERHTTGFEALADHLRPFDLPRTAAACGIPAGEILAAARAYASAKPACILWGNAVDHGPDNFQTARALMILRAVTGNLEAPGGELRPDFPLERPGAFDLTLRESLAPEIQARRLGGRRPPFLRVPPADLTAAILEERPYPVRCLLIQGANPLLTWAEARRAKAALEKVAFSAAIEHFMTPTAALADIVLPAATFLEFDSVAAPPYYPFVQAQRQVVDPAGECRSEFEIVNGLARRLGLGELFFAAPRELLDRLLAPAGIDFETLCEKGALSGERTFNRFEREGFDTPSGKVELFSARLAEMGSLALPAPRPAAGAARLDGVPGLLLTSRKSAYYLHSGGRQLRSLRARHPEPRVGLHPETARALGVAEGDPVVIESARGAIRQRVRLTAEIDPGVVWADFGWWFPEAPALFDWDRANLNILTDEREGASPETGANRLRGIPCTLRRC